MLSEMRDLIEKLAATQSRLRDLRERVEGNESRPSATEICAELTQIEAEIVAMAVRFENVAADITTTADAKVPPVASPASVIDVPPDPHPTRRRGARG